jgi:hypothetical protein
MAALLEAAFVEDSTVPFVWVCSQCDAVFSLDRMTSTPSTTQIQRVNSNFHAHCRGVHMGAPVIGLTIPAVNEDSSQAALRVVREATENK